MSASPGVTLPSTLPGLGRKAVSPSSAGLNNTLLVSDGVLEDTGSFFSNAENVLVFAVLGAFGSPAVGVLLEPMLNWQPYLVDPYSCYMCDHTWWKGFEKNIFFFFVVEEGAARSFGCFTGILIGCSED